MKSPIATILLAALIISADDRPPTCPPGKTGDCLPYRPPIPRVEPKEHDTSPPFILPVTGGYIRSVNMRRR